MKRFGEILHSVQYDWSLIRKFVVFLVTAVVIPIFFLCILLLCRSTEIILDGESKLKQDSLELYSNQISFRFGMYNTMANAIYANLELQDALLRPVNTIAELGALNEKANSSVMYARHVLNSLLLDESGSNNTYDRTTVNIYSFSVDKDYGSIYMHPISDISEESWYEALLSEGGMNRNIYENSEGQPMLRIVRLMRHFETMDIIGVLTVETPLYVIHDFTEDAFLNLPGHTLVLYDEKQHIYIISKNESELGKDVLKEVIYQDRQTSGNIHNTGNGSYYVFDHAMTFENMAIGLIVDSHVFRKRATDVLLYAIVTLLILLLAIFLLSVLIYKSIIFRIRTLNNKILLLNDDVNLPLFSIEGHDEIGVTDEALNHLILHLRELIETEYRSRLENVTLRLNMLQEQINPHLLYNTLGMIEWSAKKSNQEEIQAITSRMIRFYRSALNTGETETTISREMQTVSDYLSIICFAYELDVDVKIEIDEVIAERKIIKLIIQPIVENAIIHGLRYATVEKKKLQIACKAISENQILILIEDNGMGMDESTKTSLMQSSNQNKNYGISNVIKRLQLFYKNRYKIEIKSEINQGTSIGITLFLHEGV